MADTDPNKTNSNNRGEGVVFKGVTVGSQAEQLVRVRRELTETLELTRIERLENEAREKIEARIEQARLEADKIIGDAKRDAEGIRTKARSDGDLEAKREAVERLEGLMTSLENEINELKEIRKSFLEMNMPGIIDFSCDLAKKVLLCEIRTCPTVIAERARMLLERMPPGADVTLSVCPDDIETIRTYFRETGGISGHILARLRPDPDLQPGSIRLESDNGRIDAGFLEALEQTGSLLKEQSENPDGMMCMPGEDGNDG